jgi:hypothetical protein
MLVDVVGAVTLGGNGLISFEEARIGACQPF